ncbi:MAG: hypothetical protein ABI461_01540 [Polyangiaceae bacterium]
MTTARAFQPPSHEDIYANLDDQAQVPSCRRVTVPAIKRAKLLTQNRDAQDLKTEPPLHPPAYRPLSQDLAIPEQSVRRLRVARVQSARVPGAPDVIQEPLTEALLRDPRREE